MTITVTIIIIIIIIIIITMINFSWLIYLSGQRKALRVLPKQFKLGLEPGVLNPESLVSTSTRKSSTYIHVYEVVK